MGSLGLGEDQNAFQRLVEHNMKFRACRRKGVNRFLEVRFRRPEKDSLTCGRQVGKNFVAGEFWWGGGGAQRLEKMFEDDERRGEKGGGDSDLCWGEWERGRAPRPRQKLNRIRGA